MASGTEIIIGTLLLVGIPVLLILIWLMRRSQLRRRAAREMKTGNLIYSEWRRNSAEHPKN